jgi:sulfur-oxidizing protein SoxY
LAFKWIIGNLKRFNIMVKPNGNGPTRRAILAYAPSVLAFSLPSVALASDEGVRIAIMEDFGTADISDGDVLIDMPDYSDSGKSVPLTLTVPCTMEGLDYPEAIGIYAARNPRPRVARVYFTPACSSAVFSTRVRLDSYQDITVVVRMASGQIFKGTKKVDVTYGACEDAVANEQFPPGWAPRIRVAVPKTAAVGDAVEVRTIIGHPMETGLRHNSKGLIVPVRIAEWFYCYVNGQLAFSAKLEPAIAANPYIAFNLRIAEASKLHFEWIDTSTDIYTYDDAVAIG